MFKKNRWLTIVGCVIIGIIILFRIIISRITGLSTFLDTILALSFGLIIMGVGEMLYHVATLNEKHKAQQDTTKNKDNKNEEVENENTNEKR